MAFADCDGQTSETPENRSLLGIRPRSLSIRERPSNEVAPVEPVGEYAWEEYVSTWRVGDKLNCPPLVFEPESFDEFDAVGASIQMYQALYGQLAGGNLIPGHLGGALKICTISDASILGEKNCISVATNALLFLRSEVLRSHESGAYVYGRGAWASIGSDLPRGMVEGVPNAFKIADGLYQRGPDNWAEFSSFRREGAYVEEDLRPGESEYARRPLKWNVIKAKFIRDMRTTS